MDSTLSFINNPSDLERVLFSMVQSVVAETALLAQQSLLLLLFVMRSQPDDLNVVPDISTTDKRFPFAELNRVEKAAAENKDAGETDEEDGDDDDGDDDQEEDDGSSGEEGSDDDDEDDSEGDADSDGGSNEDDEDDEDNDNDDDDNDNDDDEDEDEEEEEENQPPYKRKK